MNEKEARECCEEARAIVLKQQEKFKDIEANYDILLDEFNTNKISKAQLIHGWRELYDKAQHCLELCSTRLLRNPVYNYVFDTQTSRIEVILLFALFSNEDFDNLGFVKEQLNEYLKKINEYEKNKLAEIRFSESEEEF